IGESTVELSLWRSAPERGRRILRKQRQSAGCRACSVLAAAGYLRLRFQSLLCKEREPGWEGTASRTRPKAQPGVHLSFSQQLRPPLVRRDKNPARSGRNRMRRDIDGSGLRSVAGFAWRAGDNRHWRSKGKVSAVRVRRPSYPMGSRCPAILLIEQLIVRDCCR